MTIQHKLGHYKDGFVSVAFCKVCGAEGDALLVECSGPIEAGRVLYFKDMTREEFEEKYGKALDASRTKAINHRY